MTIISNFKRHLAFSIIEVMVVIVIVAIVATIGHTAFLTYVMRGKMAEAVRILDEYQINAVNEFTKKGAIEPYYVLFPDAIETGWISGAPGETSAEKEVNLKYISTILAESGTSGANTYILIGVGMVHDGNIIADKDHLYMAGIITPAGVISWSCGASASHDDNVEAEFLPKNCQDTLP